MSSGTTASITDHIDRFDKKKQPSPDKVSGMVARGPPSPGGGSPLSQISPNKSESSPLKTSFFPDHKSPPKAPPSSGKQRPSPDTMDANGSPTAKFVNSKRRPPSPGMGMMSSPKNRAPSPGRGVTTSPKRPPSPGMGIGTGKPSPKKAPIPGMERSPSPERFSPPKHSPKKELVLNDKDPGRENDQKSVSFNLNLSTKRFVFSKEASGIVPPGRIRISSAAPSPEVVDESSELRDSKVADSPKTSKNNYNPLRSNPSFLQKVVKIADSDSDDEELAMVNSPNRSKRFDDLKKVAEAIEAVEAGVSKSTTQTTLDTSKDEDRPDEEKKNEVAGKKNEAEQNAGEKKPLRTNNTRKGSSPRKSLRAKAKSKSTRNDSFEKESADNKDEGSQSLDTKAMEKQNTGSSSLDQKKTKQATPVRMRERLNSLRRKSNASVKKDDKSGGNVDTGEGIEKRGDGISVHNDTEDNIDCDLKELEAEHKRISVSDTKVKRDDVENGAEETDRIGHSEQEVKEKNVKNSEKSAEETDRIGHSEQEVKEKNVKNSERSEGLEKLPSSPSAMVQLMPERSEDENSREVKSEHTESHPEDKREEKKSLDSGESGGMKLSARLLPGARKLIMEQMRKRHSSSKQPSIHTEDKRNNEKKLDALLAAPKQEKMVGAVTSDSSVVSVGNKSIGSINSKRKMIANKIKDRRFSNSKLSKSPIPKKEIITVEISSDLSVTSLGNKSNAMSIKSRREKFNEVKGRVARSSSTSPLMKRNIPSAVSKNDMSQSKSALQRMVEARERRLGITQDNHSDPDADDSSTLSSKGTLQMKEKKYVPKKDSSWKNTNVPDVVSAPSDEDGVSWQSSGEHLSVKKGLKLLKKQSAAMGMRPPNNKPSSLRASSVERDQILNEDEHGKREQKRKKLREELKLLEEEEEEERRDTTRKDITDDGNEEEFSLEGSLQSPGRPPMKQTKKSKARSPWAESAEKRLSELSSKEAVNSDDQFDDQFDEASWHDQPLSPPSTRQEILKSRIMKHYSEKQQPAIQKNVSFGKSSEPVLSEEVLSNLNNNGMRAYDENATDVTVYAGPYEDLLPRSTNPSLVRICEPSYPSSLIFEVLPFDADNTINGTSSDQGEYVDDPIHEDANISSTQNHQAARTAKQYPQPPMPRGAGRFQPKHQLDQNIQINQAPPASHAVDNGAPTQHLQVAGSSLSPYTDEETKSIKLPKSPEVQMAAQQTPLHQDQKNSQSQKRNPVQSSNRSQEENTVENFNAASLTNSKSSGVGGNENPGSIGSKESTDFQSTLIGQDHVESFNVASLTNSFSSHDEDDYVKDNYVHFGGDENPGSSPLKDDDDTLFQSTLIGQVHVDSNDDATYDDDPSKTESVAEWWQSSYAGTQNDDVNSNVQKALNQSTDTSDKNVESDDDIFFGLDDDGSPTRSEDDTRKKKPKKPIAKPYNLETIVSGDSEFEEIMNSKEPSRPKQASRKGRSNAPPNSASKQNTSSSGKRTAKVQKSGGPESDIDSSDNSPRPRKHKPALNKVTTKHTSDLRKSKQSGGVRKHPNHKSHLDSRGKSRGRTGQIRNKRRSRDDDTFDHTSVGYTGDSGTYDDDGDSYSSSSSGSRSDGSHTFGSETLESMALSTKERRKWSAWDKKDQDTSYSGMANYSDHSPTSREGQVSHMEQRARAHEKLLMHAYTALSKPPSRAMTEKGVPPHQGQNKQVQHKRIHTDQGNPSKNSLATALHDPSDSENQAPPQSAENKPIEESTVRTSKSILQQRQTLEKFCVRIKNTPLEILKLNRDGKWQTRFLTVSKEGTWLKNGNGISAGDACFCPLGLLWVKKLNKSNDHSVTNIDKHGKGGMVLAHLVHTRVEKDLADEFPLTKKQIEKYRNSVVVKLFSDGAGNTSYVIFRCSKEAAEVIVLGCTSISDVLRGRKAKSKARYPPQKTWSDDGSNIKKKRSTQMYDKSPNKAIPLKGSAVLRGTANSERKSGDGANYVGNGTMWEA